MLEMYYKLKLASVVKAKVKGIESIVALRVGVNDECHSVISHSALVYISPSSHMSLMSAAASVP